MTPALLPRSMAISEQHFIGEWHQINPRTEPLEIFVAFGIEGDLTYTIEGSTVQKILLTWKLEGCFIVTNQPSSSGEQVTRFHFESPSVLVLERENEIYKYERC
jgi:hypothetical protein